MMLKIDDNNLPLAFKVAGPPPSSEIFFGGAGRGDLTDVGGQMFYHPNKAGRTEGGVGHLLGVK